MKRSRILLVDDESELTGLWRLVLETSGRYTVEEECHGERAVRTAREFRPDVIFMDRHLSGIDGLAVAAELRADKELGSVPIVFVTGSVTQEEAARHRTTGGTPILAKPFGCDALFEVADEVLAR